MNLITRRAALRHGRRAQHCVERWPASPLLPWSADELQKTIGFQRAPVLDLKDQQKKLLLELGQVVGLICSRNPAPCSESGGPDSFSSSQISGGNTSCRAVREVAVKHTATEQRPDLFAQTKGTNETQK